MIKRLNDFFQDNIQTSKISDAAARPTFDHSIIWLKDWLDSSAQMETENEYGFSISRAALIEKDKCSIENTVEFEHEIGAYLSNIPGDLKTIRDIDEYREYILENTNTGAIFLITTASVAENMLPNFSEAYGSIKKIYILGDCSSSIATWFDHYRNKGIDILLSDCHINLVVRLLQDISKHYISKGETCKTSIPSLTSNSLIYFDWAKQMIIRANHLTENQLKSQLDNIEAYKEKTEISINQKVSDSSIEDRLRHYQQDDDSDSVAIIFIVGLELRLIQLASGITRLITCATDNQIAQAIRSVQLEAPVIIVSSSTPSDELLSLNQLLYYYYFVKSGQSAPSSTINYKNIESISSIDHLMNQLHHRLGQYYRDAAIRASIEFQDQNKAKRLLEKSTQCYKTLKANTEETLKRYAELLKKP